MNDQAAPNDQAIPADELGAHVSSAGGVHNAPARAREIGAVCLQLFTKQPSRWAEPRLSDEVVDGYVREVERHEIRFAAVHDSYLINLASPDDALRARSARSFRAELERCNALGIDALVTHPGSATDGDRASGLVRNAREVAEAMEATGGDTVVLFEITAGAGNVLGCTFEELAELIERLPKALQDRAGICFDTCHAYAAGYDLVGEYRSVRAELDRVVGLDRVGLFHLNDSKGTLGSRRDRHENIGEGELGLEPFAAILNDPAFTEVPKVLETPKGDDVVTSDRSNLGRLRALRGAV